MVDQKLKIFRPNQKKDGSFAGDEERGGMTDMIYFSGTTMVVSSSTLDASTVPSWVAHIKFAVSCKISGKFNNTSKIELYGMYDNANKKYFTIDIGPQSNIYFRNLTINPNIIGAVGSINKGICFSKCNFDRCVINANVPYGDTSTRTAYIIHSSECIRDTTINVHQLAGTNSVRVVAYSENIINTKVIFDNTRDMLKGEYITAFYVCHDLRRCEANAGVCYYSCKFLQWCSGVTTFGLNPYSMFIDCNTLVSCTGVINVSYVNSGTTNTSFITYSNCENMINCSSDIRYIDTGGGYGPVAIYGFNACTNLFNCTHTTDNLPSYMPSAIRASYGFYKCQSLTNCTGHSIIQTGYTIEYFYAFNLCDFMVNCTSMGGKFISNYRMVNCSYIHTVKNTALGFISDDFFYGNEYMTNIYLEVENEKSSKSSILYGLRNCAYVANAAVNIGSKETYLSNSSRSTIGYHSCSNLLTCASHLPASEGNNSRTCFGNSKFINSCATMGLNSNNAGSYNIDVNSSF